MQRTYVENIKPGEKVFLQGWVHEFRDLSKVKFIILRDKTGYVQCVLKQGGKAFDHEFKHEDVVYITGQAVQSNIKSKTVIPGVEVVAESIEVVNPVKMILPITVEEKDELNTDISIRLNNRVLDLRKPEHAAIFKVRSRIYKAAVEYFTKEGFINIATPKIVCAGVESGAELFHVDYFGRDAYLAQSPQIYKQMMTATGLERVYEIGTVFRAEKSRTTRHLTEFTGIDFEMAFIKDENDIMDIIEGLIKHIITTVKKECQKELALLNIKLEAPAKIPRIHMKEVKAMLAKKGKKLKSEDDLDAESEKILGEWVKKEHGNDFVFVTGYPWAIRPFYHHKPTPKADETCSFDLIWNGVEVATGAQREHNYELLKAQAKEKGINLDEMKEYSELFRCGCPPHGGVGFGIDRMTQRLLSLDNVKEAVLFPRDPDRLNP